MQETPRYLTYSRHPAAEEGPFPSSQTTVLALGVLIFLQFTTESNRKEFPEIPQFKQKNSP